MSFEHPSADVNSAGHNPDVMTRERREAADRWLDDHARPDSPYDPQEGFFQWQRLREDVLHFTPFDSLPQEQQDRARRRRARAFKESHIPWIVTDTTALLTTIDDIDDMGKARTFAKDYLIDPLANQIVKGVKRVRYGPAKDLEEFKTTCIRAGTPRQRKLYLRNSGLNDVLALGALQALKWLFPAWRFLALALQAAQALDSLFGVGLQLGPVLGWAMEKVFRGLGALGLPFGPEHNKYNQIKGARVTSRVNKQLAAFEAMHPEDTLSTLAAGYAASEHEILPPIRIDPRDYPDFADTILHPWSAPEFGAKFMKLLASIPYNAAAWAVNDLLAPMLENWSNSVNGQPLDYAEKPKTQPANPLRAYMKLADQGICPGPGCSAELYQDLSVLAGPQTRIDITTAALQNQMETVKRFGWRAPFWYEGKPGRGVPRKGGTYRPRPRRT